MRELSQTKSPRRVGGKTPTRDALLDAVERLMHDKGYAAVSYRAVAAEAGVTPALIQYYFPTLDDIFLSALRRGAEGLLERLAAELQARSHEPLRVIWEFSKEEATSAMMLEWVALGNHRQSVRDELAQVGEQIRKIHIEAMASVRAPVRFFNDELSTPALLLLLYGMPRLLRMEASLGLSTGHGEVMEAFERFLDEIEPRPPAGSQPSANQPR